MQITSEELLAEAGQMALQLRLLERENASLAAENTSLKAKLAEPAEPAGDSNPT